MQRWTQWRTEMVWTWQKQKILGRGGMNTHTHTPIQKKILMAKITTMVWSLTYSQHPGVPSQVGLRSITRYKASGGDEIPAELFQILKDDALNVLHSIQQQIWKNPQWPQDWKSSVFIPIPKKAMPKNVKNVQPFAKLQSSHMLEK